jgi:hypothetical protein
VINESYEFSTKRSCVQDSQIGTKLLENNIITEAQLEEALRRQKAKGGRLGDNLIDLKYLTSDQLDNFMHKFPSAPRTIADTALNPSFLADLILKHIHFLGEFRLADVAERIKLPISVIDQVLEILQREKMIEVKGASEYTRTSYTFSITGLGQKRASELLDICRYVGPAPVTLDEYRKQVSFQTVKNVALNHQSLVKAFSNLVINPHLLNRLGPAVNSGRAIFMYGPPGNGKTSIAENIGNVLPQTIYIPYSLIVEGEIINIFDPVNHVPVSSETEDNERDMRWQLIKRPVVMTGGELTLKTLDLEFNSISKFYMAPLQMKANNGLFIIDDFGRQQIEPKMLLNRWIVPLERRVDFMTLHTGMKFEIPFDQLVIFCTNLQPKDLVDEAFLRRIRYKINISYPTEIEFEAIFRKICDDKGVSFDKKVFDYLMERYRKHGIQPSACHPRDLIEQIVDHSRYYHQAPQMTFEMITEAWDSYFVEL